MSICYLQMEHDKAKIKNTTYQSCVNFLIYWLVDQQKNNCDNYCDKRLIDLVNF